MCVVYLLVGPDSCRYHPRVRIPCHSGEYPRDLDRLLICPSCRRHGRAIYKGQIKPRSTQNKKLLNYVEGTDRKEDSQ